MVDMQGWLTKRPDHMNIIWSERFFILEGNQLRYYKKNGDPTPRETYVLTAGCVVGNVFNSEQKHRHHDAVWMFRITFAVVHGQKSYRKDRFVDLGAKTEENANMWKKKLEIAINTVREISEFRQTFDIEADIGAPPDAVKKLLDNEDDAFSLFDLSSDNSKTENNWWTARVAEGLRIMEECPSGYSAAALQFSRQARKLNELLFSAVTSAIISSSLMYMICPNIMLCFGAAASAVGLCFLIFGIIGCSYDTPSYKVSQIVQGSTCSAFRLIMNLDRYHTWDESVVSMRVIQALDSHADILHIVFRPVFIWPFWQQARDVVVMRYWRRDDDGSYLVMYQSTTHPECRPQHHTVRAHLVGGFIIAPQKTTTPGTVRAHVTHVLRFDAKGCSHILSQLGFAVDLVLPLLRRVIGIRDELSSVVFVKPMIRSPVEGMVDDESHFTSVDSSGLILGVKKLKSNLPENMWAEPCASKFNVRGPDYLTKRKKISAGPAAFHLVGVDLFSFERNGDQYNIGSCPESAVNQTSEFTFIINMIVPGPENMALAFYYQASRPQIFEERSAFSELLNQFIHGDDAFRNSRFKLIPTVDQASFIIKQAVGSKPALIGNKLKCPYTSGSNYFEIDIDIASNSVANTVVAMVRGVTKAVVVDIAFLFESQYDEELPETILGTVRLHKVSLDDPVKIKRKAA